MDIYHPTKFGQNLMVNYLARASQASCQPVLGNKGHNSVRNGETVLMFELIRELMDVYHPTPS